MFPLPLPELVFGTTFERVLVELPPKLLVVPLDIPSTGIAGRFEFVGVREPLLLLLFSELWLPRFPLLLALASGALYEGLLEPWPFTASLAGLVISFKFELNP